MSVDLHKVIARTSHETIQAWEDKKFAKAIGLGFVSRITSAALFVFQMLLIISFPARLAVKAIIISIEDKRRKLLQERSSPGVASWCIADWNQHGKGLVLSGGSMFTSEILYTKEKIHKWIYAEAIRGTFATTRIPEEELEKYQRTCVSVGLSADVRKFETSVLDIWQEKSLRANWQSDHGRTDVEPFLRGSVSEASIREINAAREELADDERQMVNQRISKQVSEITTKGWQASEEEQTRYIALRELRLADGEANNKEHAAQPQIEPHIDNVEDLREPRVNLHELSEKEHAERIRDEENLMRLFDDVDPLNDIIPDPAPLPALFNPEPVFRPEPPPDDIDIVPPSLRPAQPGRRPVLTQAQLLALSATDEEIEKLLKVTSMDPAQDVPKTLDEENKIFCDKMYKCLQDARTQMEFSKRLPFRIGMSDFPKWQFNLVQKDNNSPGFLDPGTEIQPKTLQIYSQLGSFIDIGPQKVTKALPPVGNQPPQIVTFIDVNRGTLKREDGNTESYIDYSTGEVTLVTNQPAGTLTQAVVRYHPYFSSECIQNAGEEVMAAIWKVGIYNYFSPKENSTEAFPLYAFDTLEQLKKQILKGKGNFSSVLDVAAYRSLYNKIMSMELIPDNDPIRLKLMNSIPFIVSKIDQYNEIIKRMEEPKRIVSLQEKLKKLILELKEYNDKRLENLMLLMLAKTKKSYIEKALVDLDASVTKNPLMRVPSAILNDIFITVGDICTTFEKEVFSNKTPSIDWQGVFK